VKTLTLWLTLPFSLALALGLHAGISRAVKAVLESARPLSTAEPEAFRYERSVYGTPASALQPIIGLALLAGLLFWLAMGWGRAWGWTLGLLLVAGAVTIDLLRWQRAAASANYVWTQDGVRGPLTQVAIENISELSVQEDDEAGGFTLRHGQANRRCRVHLRLNSDEAVKLPWTDAHTGLDAVEAMANHVRARQQIRGEGQSLQRAADQASDAARQAARQVPSQDAEMRRELKRLRQGALAPDLPPAAHRKRES
jgi:hypothetical protein